MYIFKPKIPIWVNFGGSSTGRCLYILWHLVYFTAIWYMLWTFGIFFPIWVFCNKKKLATLSSYEMNVQSGVNVSLTGTKMVFCGLNSVRQTCHLLRFSQFRKLIPFLDEEQLFIRASWYKLLCSIFGDCQHRGCQMVCFQTKNLDLGKFLRALERKKLVYSIFIWKILRPFGIVYGHLAIKRQFGIFPPVLLY
jgi:hypothetical protein